MSVTPQASQAHVTSVECTRESVSRYRPATAETLRNKILRSPNAKFMYVCIIIMLGCGSVQEEDF